MQTVQKQLSVLGFLVAMPVDFERPVGIRVAEEQKKVLLLCSRWVVRGHLIEG